MQARNAQNDGFTVSADDLRALLHEAQAAEQKTGRKFARMARGASTTDSKLGTICGVGVGVLSGIGLATGIVPGAEALASVSAMLPIVGGAFCAGIGLLVGTYIDLHGVTGRE